MSEVNVEAGGGASIQIFLIDDRYRSASGVKILRRGTEMPEPVVCSGFLFLQRTYSNENFNKYKINLRLLFTAFVEKVSIGTPYIYMYIQ